MLRKVLGSFTRGTLVNKNLQSSINRNILLVAVFGNRIRKSFWSVKFDDNISPFRKLKTCRHTFKYIFKALFVGCYSRMIKIEAC